ncbi:MAG TPA: glycosyltransferase, partial [Roseomonas sp.]
HTVQAGKILAANDNMWLGYHLKRKKVKEYKRNLGLSSDFDYFNCGVLALQRETMDDMFPKALEFFLKNSQICAYHDQSALNAVFAGRREVLSPLYNFISDYYLLNVLGDANPALLHFTGGGKPWAYDGPPWGNKFLASYPYIIENNPGLSAYAKIFDPGKSADELNYYNRRRSFYRKAVPIYLLRRSRFLRYMRKSNFSC